MCSSPSGAAVARGSALSVRFSVSSVSLLSASGPSDQWHSSLRAEHTDSLCLPPRQLRPCPPAPSSIPQATPDEQIVPPAALALPATVDQTVGLQSPPSSTGCVCDRVLPLAVPALPAPAPVAVQQATQINQAAARQTTLTTAVTAAATAPFALPPAAPAPPTPVNAVVPQAAQVEQAAAIAMQDELAATGTRSVTLPPAAPAPPTLVPVAFLQATQVK